jgi:hypothetical protein
MKSRFLESECKRLNYSLQCFMSENMALRQTLHSNEIAAGKDKKPHRADVAMRESAVLFLGELPKHKYFIISYLCTVSHSYSCSNRNPLVCNWTATKHELNLLQGSSCDVTWLVFWIMGIFLQGNGHFVNFVEIYKASWYNLIRFLFWLF